MTDTVETSMPTLRQTLNIWTDGSAGPTNPGFGGWAFRIVNGNGSVLHEESGFATNPTTNNRMEMTAVMRGLSRAYEIFGDWNCTFEIRSDSSYVVNCMRQGWWKTWVSNGWKNSKGKTVENKDLWLEILARLQMHNQLHGNRWHRTEFVHVKGHVGVQHNEACDQAAKGEYLHARANPSQAHGSSYWVSGRPPL